MGGGGRRRRRRRHGGADRRGPEPPLEARHLGARWLALPIDFDFYFRAETVAAADLFLVDDVGQFDYYRELGHFQGWPEPAGSVGEGLARDGSPERVVCCNLGIGALDAAFANAVLERARAEEVGIELDCEPRCLARASSNRRSARTKGPRRLPPGSSCWPRPRETTSTSIPTRRTVPPAARSSCSSTGGDPARGLDLHGRAVTAIAEDLRTVDRQLALEEGLRQLRLEAAGLPLVSEAIHGLTDAPEVAWRAYAAGILALELEES